MSSINFNPAKKIRINNKEIKKVCHMTTVVWSSMDETYNYFVVKPTADYMSVVLYENLDKTGEAAAYATDWGDGVVDNNTSHTYSEIGTYTIKTKLQPGSSSSDNNNITECLGIRKDITSMKIFFKNAKALVKCCDIPNTIIDMQETFYGCSLFNQPMTIPDSVIYMIGTFLRCASFNSPVKIGSNVKYLLAAFEGCTNFNQPVVIPDGVLNMQEMFGSCPNFNQPIIIPNTVQTIQYLCCYCDVFNQPINIPDSVLTASHAFFHCYEFNSPVTIGSSVTSLSRMFEGCKKFNQPITFGASVTYADYMFRDCKAFNSPVVMNDKIIDIERIFYLCESFNQPIEIPQSMQIMYCAFQGATSFNQDLEIPSGIVSLYGLLHSVGNSYNSLITLNFDIEDSLNNNTKYDPIAVQLFTHGSSANRIKICGGINNDSFKILLSQLSNPTTIDIRELSSSNIYDIVLDEEIMNIIDTGKNGTPHTLLWMDEMYNYFTIEPSNTNGMSVTLYENPDKVGETAIYATDWGDGTVNTETEHTYSEYDRAYIIKTKLQPGSSNNNNITECLNIRKDITSMKNFFKNTKALVKCCSIPDTILNVEYAFSNCTSFNQEVIIPPNVTSMYGTFEGCTVLNSNIIIPDGVVDMSDTFWKCSSFNQNIKLPSQLKDMYCTFQASGMNQQIIIPDGVINMCGAFQQCSSFNQLITIPDSVTRLEMTFYGCTNLNQPIVIPKNVTNMARIFYNCISFNQPIEIPQSMKNMYCAFQGATSFNQDLEIPSGIETIYGLLHSVGNSYNSLITLNFDIEDSLNNNTKYDPIAVQLFTHGSSANRIKICGGINNNSFKILLSQLSNPTTIDIRELSSSNIYDIVLDEEIMNIIDTGKNGTPHTLLWADETYSYFVVEPSNTNGMSVTLYENPDKVGETAIYATDWGDGVVDNNTSHTYSAEGTYIIKTKLQSAETSNINNNITKCLNIRNDITDMSYFFKNFKSLVYCSSNIHDNIINMNCTFAECTLFNSPINIGKNVKTLGGTFSKCSNFNQSITIPNGVTDISELFDYCSNFNQPITIPDGVKDMSYTFRNCSNFNQSVNIPDGVEFIENIFYGCTAFNQEVIIPDSVTSVYAAFQNCTSFNSNVAMGSSITNAHRVFQGCTNFNKSVIFGPNVTGLSYAFLNCKSLNSLITIDSNSPVTNMSAAFFGCELFNQPVNIPNSVTSLTGIFQGCTNFNQPINIPKNAYNVNGILNGCISFNSIVTFDVSNETNLVLTDAFANSSVNSIKFTGTLQNELMTNILGILVNPTTIDIRELSKDDTISIINNTNIMNIIDTGINGTPHILLYNEIENTLLFNYFEITTNNTNGYSITLYENPEYVGDVSAYKTDWGDGTVNNSTSHTYSTNGTYTIKTKLQPSSEANKNSTNTNIVKCVGIREDITNLDYFFNNCTKLSTIENSVLSNVTTMKWCFNNCSSLVSINMSNWDLTNVVNMSYMFKDCVNLTNATFSNTTTLDSLENGENVFYNCTSLTDTNLLDQI